MTIPEALHFDDESGLVPVVAQDHATGEIRMLAFATREAVARTLETGRATFFSRSRGALWVKGETSGNDMLVHAVLADCDRDALVYLVSPRGPTCHTGAPSCFFRTVSREGGELVVREDAAPPATVLRRLDAVLEARRTAVAEKSYAKSLYDGGPEKIGQKLREEADELARAVAAEPPARVVSEAADVLFHVMVALRSRGASFDEVVAELARREGTSGHDEKRARAAPGRQKS